MRKFLIFGALLCALSPAFAQDTGKPLAAPGGVVTTIGGAHRNANGNAEYDSDTTPHPTLCYVKVNGVVSPCSQGSGGGGGGDASATNQTAVQAAAGSNATKAVAVQGIDGGKPIPLKAANGDVATLGSTADPYNCSTDTTAVTEIAALKCAIVQLKAVVAALPASLGQKTQAASLAVTTASDGPLGNQSDAACASVSGSCSNIALGKATVATGNTNAAYNAPYAGAVLLTVGTAVSGANIGRAIATSCTVAGNVNLTLSNASSITVPVPSGLLILPFAVTTVASSGTTATCTYSNLL